MEIWGGIECTLNRVHDRRHDQVALSGHRARLEDDLAAFAALGLSALRYPVLWESVEPERGRLFFDEADRALDLIRHGGMRPIVGLLHHGSGPLWTSLADPLMPASFARYAGAVARRHPEIDDYTPVNEPLTTARFAGLYGHWYPHASNDRAFVTMLLHEVRATVLAMSAIRAVNPEARLIQTEDLGRAAGTAATAAQVDFENGRRWLTTDLLAGRVDSSHPLHAYLVGLGGASADDLRWLADHPCPPDVIGVNHYPRSDRWLDHRLGLHPPSHQGGNGILRYADVAVCDLPWAMTPPSFTELLVETWQRYRIPVALTEVHVPGADATEIAWWESALVAANEARDGGADIRAVTTWSLVGSFDWDTLCTTETGPTTYECGAFDVSSGHRIVTPLGEAVRRSAARADVR